VDGLRAAIAGTLAATAALLLHQSRPAAAAAPTLAIEAAPAPLAVPASGTTPLLLTLSNGGTAAVQSIMVSADGGLGLAAAITQPGSTSLNPGASTVWRLDVTRKPSGALPDRVLVRIGYTGSAGPEEVATSVAATSATAESSDTLAKVVVHSGLKTVDDFRGGDVNLVVSNAATAAIVVDSINPQTPEHVKADRKAGTSGCTQAPKETPCRIDVSQSATFTYHVHAKNVTKTGDDVVLFRLRVKSADGAAGSATDIVASYPITVGLFGESELAKLFQIPTITLAPAFFLVAVIGFLWRGGLRRPGTAATAFPTTSSGDFWVLTLVAAAGLLSAFWAVTRRNPLTGTTVLDTAVLAMIAVVIALVGYGVPMLALAWRRRRREVKPGMTAREALTRLKRQDGPIRYPKATVDQTDYLLFEERGADALVVAAIAYTNLSLTAQEADAIVTARNRPTIGEAAKLIGQAERANKVSLQWDPLGQVPRLASQLVRGPGTSSILELGS